MRLVGRSSAVLKADMRGTYTVSFCDKYGAVIHTRQKNYGEDITLWSTTPTMSSYEFVCWIDEESGEMYIPGDQFFKNIKKLKEGTDEYKEYYEKNKDFLRNLMHKII